MHIYSHSHANIHTQHQSLKGMDPDKHISSLFNSPQIC